MDGRPDESDVDLIDCHGQSAGPHVHAYVKGQAGLSSAVSSHWVSSLNFTGAGGGVVQLSLFDAWIRFAVKLYRDVPFIGRWRSA